MKNFIAIVVAAILAYFAWGYMKPPTLEGDPIPDEQRVLFVQANGPVSVSDQLDKGTRTLLLFTASGSADSDAIERRLETAVRQRVKTVRLVIIDVGGLGSPAAGSMKLTKLPSAFFFDGYTQRSDDLDEILKLMGA